MFGSGRQGLESSRQDSSVAHREAERGINESHISTRLTLLGLQVDRELRREKK